MYSEMEIKIANATSRTNGASARNKDGSVRAIVPRYISENEIKMWVFWIMVPVKGLRILFG